MSARQEIMRHAVLALTMLSFISCVFAQSVQPVSIVGIDQAGKVHNVPKDWPVNAGAWNGKAARYNPKTQKLVFETFREDIVGGSVICKPDVKRSPGANRLFVAGPESGPVERSGTTVIYVSGRNGEQPRGIGCTDMEDGKSGVIIYLVDPSISSTPCVPVRQQGAVVYANQNKDLAAWHPQGQWLFIGVEMNRHALTHHVACSEIGMFNNLWAVSVDGKIWVQLTNYEKTWQYYDSVAMMPYAACDVLRCPVNAQYATRENQHPYRAYSGSQKDHPPPASGTMRPTVGNNEREGKTPVVWAERVGIDPNYTWAGVLHLATADIVFTDGIPALVNYRRNLTPSPSKPDGKNLWANPGGSTAIGAGYEAWSFSRDDSEILFASDVFLSSSSPAGKRGVSPWTQAFTDVVSWRWQREHALWNVTDFNPQTYAYKDNGSPVPSKYYGHWEEPAVYLLSKGRSDCIAFASSADLIPAWNPMDHSKTFGMDVWLTKRDGKSPAKRITFFNRNNGPRLLAYPTATDPFDDALFLTVVPGGKGGANPPGTIYVLATAEL